MIQIKPIEHHQITEACQVICSVTYEFFGPEQKSSEDFESFCDKIWSSDLLHDLKDISAHYSENGGTFLVLMDEERVVGTGALRRLDEQTCELKRMWFLPEYRGLGWGQRMVEMLIEFSRQHGYSRMLLDTSRKQSRAQRLYEKLGFTPIERYNDGPCELFMEKILK